MDFEYDPAEDYYDYGDMEDDYEGEDDYTIKTNHLATMMRTLPMTNTAMTP
jgi:hypothetical protein